MVAQPIASGRAGARAITRAFREQSRRPSAAWVAFDLASYVALTLVAASTASGPLALAAGVASGVMVSRLFILGHDACHGSLFGTRRLNEVIGRVVFLPAWTPYSLWEVGHNVAHHGFTNLKGRDHVWTPMSKAEFDAASPFRRLLERIYRSGLAGMGLYYGIELWWKRLYFPSRRHVGARRREHWLDSSLVTVFIVGHAAVVVSVAHACEVPAWQAVVAAVVVPQVVWNALMGFVIYVQHTHPDIAWFDNRREWEWFSAQLASTPHVEFPLPFSALLHNIMEHTVHHLDVHVPHHALPAAQAELEHALGHGVRRHAWSWREFRRTVRTCRLYDYERHCWVDYDGTVTSRAERPARPASLVEVEV